jgi:hypothetical protein
MYLEEKIAELEARIKKLEEQKPSTNDDMIIVKFQRDSDLEASVPVKRVPIQVRREPLPEPKITYGHEEPEEPEEEPEEPEEAIEQESEEIDQMLQERPIKTAGVNKWVVIQDKPGEEIYRYNKHTLTLFDENGKKFAQVDNLQPQTLPDKERKAYKEVERIKAYIEKKFTLN